MTLNRIFVLGCGGKREKLGSVSKCFDVTLIHLITLNLSEHYIHIVGLLILLWRLELVVMDWAHDR